MGHSFLKLNENETEIIMFGSPTASVDISSVLGPLIPYKGLLFVDFDKKIDKQIISVVSASSYLLKIMA